MFEWLAEHQLVSGLTGVIVVPAILYGLGILLKREKTVKWGYNLAGLFITFAFWEKMKPITDGKIKDRIFMTLDDFLSGFLAKKRGLPCPKPYVRPKK